MNLQLVMVLNYLYAAYNLLIGLQSGSVWLLSLGIYTLMLAAVRTDLTLAAPAGYTGEKSRRRWGGGR